MDIKIALLTEGGLVDNNEYMHIYNDEIKEEVRLLRMSGLSIGQIQKLKNIPRTTIRDWIAATSLTPHQQADIKKRVIAMLQKGRIEAQRVQTEKRNRLIKQLMEEGIRDVGKLNTRDIFVIGIGLYWAEGFKNLHERRLGFCNSDPGMMQFYVQWLETCFSVEKKNLIARLTLNKLYEKRTRELETYWSKTTGIPLSQFTKPFYQTSIWKKQFNTENYHGVLRIHVKDSLELLLKMRGWIEGLKENVLK